MFPVNKVFSNMNENINEHNLLLCKLAHFFIMNEYFKYY